MNNVTPSNAEMQKLVIPRFLKYVKYWTTSDHHIAETPSTPGQIDLAKALMDELKTLGIKRIQNLFFLVT